MILPTAFGGLLIHWHWTVTPPPQCQGHFWLLLLKSQYAPLVTSGADQTHTCKLYGSRVGQPSPALHVNRWKIEGGPPGMEVSWGINLSSGFIFYFLKQSPAGDAPTGKGGIAGSTEMQACVLRKIWLLSHKVKVGWDLWGKGQGMLIYIIIIIIKVCVKCKISARLF